jgi:aryl-alcohol dehydrogenase-like predicted oxidoreductase
MNIDRRGILKCGLSAAAFCLLPKIFGRTQPATEANTDEPNSGPLITKPIPSSGVRLPVVGIGTNHFDHATPKAEAELKEVLRLLPIFGGKVIDMAEGYGEPVVGELVSELENRDRLFLATKVGVEDGAGKAAGLAQIDRSFRRLRTQRIDLIAVHSLGDTETQLATLRDLKQAGRIRYVGVTTSSGRQHAELEAVMKAQTLDFIQVDYAIDNRGAAERILPLAQDRGMAVMINLPFGRGRVFGLVQGKPLPDWVAEFDCRSWGQFFLKYIVSHPAVTCAIPGTTRVTHLRDNVQAAHGRLPDAAMRGRMEKFIDTL